MKVALVSHLYPGVESLAHGTFIHEQAIALREQVTLDVFVPTVRALPFTSRFKYNHSALMDEGDAKRVRYLSFPQKKFPGIIQRNLISRLVPAIERGGYDIIHINWAYPDALVIPELKKRGFATILHIHGSDWYKSQKPKRLGQLVGQSLQSADRILAVGNNLRKDILSVYPHLERNIFVHHNAVDTEMFSLSEDKTAAKKHVSWVTGIRHVLCVANLRPEKGIDVLLHALQVRHLPDTQFHIIGNTFSDDYQERIESQIKGYDLPVTIHPPVAHHELKKYYHAADLFVLPSRKEGFGLALAEAGSTGLPLISTKSGGPKDIINSKNGLLISPDSIDELADALAYMLKHVGDYKPGKIRKDIVTRFDKALMTKKLLEHYNHILND